MINKIFSWVMMILNIFMVLYCLVNIADYGLFVLVYFVGIAYISMKYVELLK